MVIEPRTEFGYLVPRAVQTTEHRVIPRSWHVAKRVIDICVASLALILTSPIIIVAALAVMATSKGGPFFSQLRIGKDGRSFRIIKLRTMVTGAELMHAELRQFNEVSGPVFKMKNDPRTFPVGRFLRRTSIDELPNFLCVLRGDMSVVGPRPPLPSEVAHYSNYALRRLLVKPGITCSWQISGRSSVHFDEWMDMDNAYVDSWSPLTDLKIVLATIPAVVRARGAH
jgi:lipopolysaccharide/colanic/teichoic acid biosynthesis glycosyltransferase